VQIKHIEMNANAMQMTETQPQSGSFVLGLGHFPLNDNCSFAIVPHGYHLRLWTKDTYIPAINRTSLCHTVTLKNMQKSSRLEL